MPFHVYQGNAGTDPSWESTTARNLALFETDNTESAVTIFSPANATNVYYAFADPGSRIAGAVKYGHSADLMTFVLGATDRVQINSDGDILPVGDNSQDLGAVAKRWQNIYTGDLHLANERGNWTVIEEENYLTLRNNKTDKVYKLGMEEIE